MQTASQFLPINLLIRLRTTVFLLCLVGLVQSLIRFKFSSISAATAIWQSDSAECLGFIFLKTSIIRTYPHLSPNFGDVGICRWVLGFVIMYTFLLGEAVAENYETFSIFLLCGHSQDYGTVQILHLSYGA